MSTGLMESMEFREIQKEFPQFMEWVNRTKGYFTADKEWIIGLWYEYLREKNNDRGDEKASQELSKEQKSKSGGD
jgi:hypothetical protein